MSIASRTSERRYKWTDWSRGNISRSCSTSFANISDSTDGLEVQLVRDLPWPKCWNFWRKEKKKLKIWRDFLFQKTFTTCKHKRAVTLVVDSMVQCSREVRPDGKKLFIVRNVKWIEMMGRVKWKMFAGRIRNTKLTFTTCNGFGLQFGSFIFFCIKWMSCGDFW